MASESFLPIDFKVYVITNRKLCQGRPLLNVLQQLMKSGVRAIQLREKDLSGRELYGLAKDIRELCESHQTQLFINDRADVALGVNAHGVQLTERSLAAGIVRKLVGKRLIGVSTHSIASAQKAQDSGCNFVLFGPVFETPEKHIYGAPQGLAELKKIARAVQIPVFAVGGIDARRAKKCLEAGAHGVAGISEFMCSRNLPDTVRAFADSLGSL